MIHTVTFLSGVERDGTRDCYKVRLRVARDGEYFQFVTPMVSGPRLLDLDREDLDRDVFWSAVVEEAVELIRKAVVAGDIPLERPEAPYEVLPSVLRCIGRAKSTPRTFAEGDVVGAFDLAPDCEELRRRIVLAKGARNRALTDNAEAENAGRPLPYTEEDLVDLRAVVHMAALAAREAGCDVEDLMGPDVGDRDSPF